MSTSTCHHEADGQMVQRWLLSDDETSLDVPKIHHRLSIESYWADVCEWTCDAPAHYGGQEKRLGT
jgi:hypothetical protein